MNRTIKLRLLVRPPAPVSTAIINLDNLIFMKNTSCPKCHKEFPIHENRAFKTKIRGNFFAPFDAMSQLTNYDIVICPFCKESFQSPEAKLFWYFKSPFTVLALGMLIVAALLVLEFLLNKS